MFHNCAPTFTKQHKDGAMCPVGKRPATGGATGDGTCCLCRGCGLKVHTSRKYMCHQIDRGQSSQGLVCPNSAGGREHSLLYCSASACANAGTQRKEKKLLAAAGNGQAPLPTPLPRFQPQTPQQIPLMVHCRECLRQPCPGLRAECCLRRLGR